MSGDPLSFDSILRHFSESVGARSSRSVHALSAFWCCCASFLESVLAVQSIDSSWALVSLYRVVSRFLHNFNMQVKGMDVRKCLMRWPLRLFKLPPIFLGIRRNWYHSRWITILSLNRVPPAWPLTFLKLGPFWLHRVLLPCLVLCSNRGFYTLWPCRPRFTGWDNAFRVGHCLDHNSVLVTESVVFLIHVSNYWQEGSHTSFEYGRYGNPTTFAAESKIR